MVTILEPFFGYRHNLGLFQKVAICGLLFKSQKRLSFCHFQELQKLKHSESVGFFSLKIFSAFDWIQIIVAVAGVLRNTIEPSHTLDKSSLKFEVNITKNEHSTLLFLIYV